MTAAVQTLWAELLASTLAGAGAGPCVISPGSRSTPLVIALARAPLELVTIVDERAAAFYALGAARATGRPAVLVCTSGSAAAHYLPAIVEASTMGVPLIAITADRPPELHDCGASQTIDQRAIYGGFVRAAFDLGAPAAGDPALRAAHRKLRQAITAALGPVPGPVHVNVPLRKPLEPAPPATDDDRALARLAGELARGAGRVAPPGLAADPEALARLARAIAAEPHGAIVAGAMPVAFGGAREAVFELARRAGYPVIAEAGSQLRLGPRPHDVAFVDHLDLIPAGAAPHPALIVQLGCEPVAAAWPGFVAEVEARGSSPEAGEAGGPTPRRGIDRRVLALTWRDPASSAEVLLGDPATSVRALARALRPPRDAALDLARARRAVERTAATRDWLAAWRQAEAAAAAAAARAIAEHPDAETAVLGAAIAAAPAGTIVQIGNSLPVRTIDHACAGGPLHPVIAQRGAAGIDGMIASAAGATRAGHPVLLAIGDVAFAHDLGALVAARAATARLAILVLDNAGGQIFADLPVARAGLGDAFARHWLAAPAIDPAAVAGALGARAIAVRSPATAAAAVTTALSLPGPTVIHAIVSASGARDVRRAARAPTPPTATAQLGGTS